MRIFIIKHVTLYNCEDVKSCMSDFCVVQNTSSLEEYEWSRTCNLISLACYVCMRQ